MPRLFWIYFLITTSARNLLRSPRRTLISILVIASAAAAMVVFQSFVDGVQKTFRQNVITSTFGHFQISKKGFHDNESDKPFAYQIKSAKKIRKAIEEIAPVKMFTLRQPFYGLINFNDRSMGGIGFGVQAEEEQKFLTLTQVREGKALAGSPKDSIFIGYILARRLHIKVGDLVTILVTTSTGSLNALDLEVVGTFETGVTDLDEGTYQIHQQTAEELLKVDGAPIVIVGLEQDDETPFMPKFEELIERDFAGLELTHWKKLAFFFDNTMGWIKKQVFVFRWIILIIASIGIVTVFMMGLFERTGEFGTLRAIGTHRRSIATMIFVESLMQSALGALLGILIGMGIITILLRQGIVMPPPPMMSVPFHVQFFIPWANLPWTFLLCVLAAGGAGVFPALKMARMGVVEALGRNV